MPTIPDPGATHTPTPTPVTTGSRTPTATPTATPTREFPGCVGDCNTDGRVAVNELVRGTNLALDPAMLDQCPSIDPNGDGAVAINEVILAVNDALKGCPEGM